MNFKDRFLFLSGGRQNKIISNNVEMYDVTANSWTIAPDLSVERCNHSGCSLNDSIYVFCGFSNNKRLKCIESLDA